MRSIPLGAVRRALQIKRAMSNNTGAGAGADSPAAAGRVGDLNAYPPAPGGAAGGGSRAANARPSRMASVAISPTPTRDRIEIPRSWPDIGPNTARGVKRVGR